MIQNGQTGIFGVDESTPQPEHIDGPLKRLPFASLLGPAQEVHKMSTSNGDGVRADNEEQKQNTEAPADTLSITKLEKKFKTEMEETQKGIVAATSNLIRLQQPLQAAVTVNGAGCVRCLVLQEEINTTEDQVRDRIASCKESVQVQWKEALGSRDIYIRRLKKTLVRESVQNKKLQDQMELFKSDHEKTARTQEEIIQQAKDNNQLLRGRVEKMDETLGSESEQNKQLQEQTALLKSDLEKTAHVQAEVIQQNHDHNQNLQVQIKSLKSDHEKTVYDQEKVIQQERDRNQNLQVQIKSLKSDHEKTVYDQEKVIQQERDHNQKLQVQMKSLKSDHEKIVHDQEEIMQQVKADNQLLRDRVESLDTGLKSEAATNEVISEKKTMSTNAAIAKGYSDCDVPGIETAIDSPGKKPCGNNSSGMKRTSAIHVREVSDEGYASERKGQENSSTSSSIKNRAHDGRLSGPTKVRVDKKPDAFAEAYKAFWDGEELPEDW